MTLLDVKLCLLLTYRLNPTNFAMWDTAKRLRELVDRRTEQGLIVDVVLRANDPRKVVELALLEDKG